MSGQSEGFSIVVAVAENGVIGAFFLLYSFPRKLRLQLF
jgi:hypothetical protein